MHTVSIGIDLHKQQFTCYFLKGSTGKFFEFTSDKTGINQFKKRLKRLAESGFKVKMAVESTGNTKYFKKELEKDGYTVLVVNTLKFKVVNESVNKTDKRDARTIAEFLEKDMLRLGQLSSDV